MPTSNRRRKRRDQRRVSAVLQAMPDRFAMPAADVQWSDWIEAAEDAGSGRLPKFSMVAYTGGLLNVRAFYYPVVVDLSGVETITKSRPILRDHDPSKVVGHTEGAGSYGVTISQSTLTAEGIVSGTCEDAQDVVATAKNGFQWQASIGVRVLERGFVDVGESTTVNGQTFNGPVYVARRSQLREVSFVALGADDNTSANVAASAANHEEAQDMTFEQWLAASGWGGVQLTEQQTSTLRAAYDAEHGDDSQEPPQNVTASAVDIESARRQAADELDRQSRIRTICASYDSPSFAPQEGQSVDLAAHAIRHGWDANRTELEAMRSSRPSTPAIHSQQQQQPWAVLEAALCNRVGIPAPIMEASYSQQQLDQATSQRARRSASLHALMHQMLQAAGIYHQPGVVDDEFIRASFRASSRLEAMGGADLQASAGGFTVISLPGILGAVANKSLLAAYQAVNTVWQLFCSTADHGNFHTHTRYRLTGSGQFVPLGPDGELKHATLGEESYTNKVDTKGRILTLTRQDIINDDLNAFMGLAQILGRGGALALEEAFFKVLLGNANNFFHANNKNLLTGTAFSIDGLTAAVAKYDEFVDAHGKPVLAQPDRLLVPPALYVPAREVYDETKVVGPSGSKAPASNPHAGSYVPHKSPYLSNSAIKDENGASLSGQSATSWYLFADPVLQAAFEVAFLQGRRTPTIESGETHFNTLGMSWRGYWDFGVAQQNPRGAVKVTA